MFTKWLEIFQSTSTIRGHPNEKLRHRRETIIKIEAEENFAMISMLPFCATNCADIFKIVLTTFDSVSMYDNDEPMAYGQAKYLEWEETTFLTEIYLRSLSWFVQGGITAYQKLINKILFSYICI